MLENPATWSQLVSEYADLRLLKSGMTRQARGQRFNGLIAELFRVFGMDAKPNVRGVGELDVTFNHGGRRFILEAKWEQRKIGTGPIAKLQRRVQQRMAGVTGVFLSMEGYTDEALGEVDKGQRLEIVLLDRTHWEAMLSGFVPPPELLELVTDSASFQGQAYTPLEVLLDPRVPVPPVAFGVPPELDHALLHPDDRGITAHVVVSRLESERPGITTTEDGRLLLTLTEGIISVDTPRRKVKWEVPLTGCSNSPLPLPDGSIMVTRAHGVGRYQSGRVAAISSGSAGHGQGQLLQRPDGSIWCFDRGASRQGRLNAPTLTRLGAQVGDEQRTEVPYPPGAATAASWLTRTIIVVGGDPDLLILSASGAIEQRLALPSSYPACMLGIGDGRLLTVAGDLTLGVTSLAAREHVTLGLLQRLDGSLCRMASGVDDTAYLMAPYSLGDGSTAVAVLQLKTTNQWWADPRSATEEGGSSQALTVRVPSQGVHTPTVEAVSSLRAETVAPVPISAVSMPRHIAASPPALAQTAIEPRLREERQGRADGAVAAQAIPLYALEGLVATQFDVVQWLLSWREAWRLAIEGKRPLDATMSNWLPPLARFLGSYVAPTGLADAHFAPPPAYVVGFVSGLRTTWQAAVAARLVPSDITALSRWLRQQDNPASPAAAPRHLLTIRDLRRASARARITSGWKWAGRVLLWLATGFFGAGTIVAIIATTTDTWGRSDAGYVVGGDLFYSIPFIGLLWLTIVDARRIRRRRRRATGDVRESARL